MTKWAIALLLILILAISAFTNSSNKQTFAQVKVFFDSKPELIALLQNGLDIVDEGDNYLVIIAKDTELQQLQADGYTFDIEHADLTAHYQSRLFKRTPMDMGGYKTLSEIYDALDTLIINNPAIVSNKVSIGQTIEGRDQWAVKISDNPNVDEGEPEILFTAATHAREVITPELLLYYMNYLTSNYGVLSEITDLVDNREIWFILVVNPDGYFHNEVIEPSGGGMWRKNRRDNGDGTFGVDLNRNFGYEWGYDDNGSSPVTDDATYRGTAPFSEPETQNLKAFIESHEFVITIYYHSYGNLILWPWGYERIYCEDNDIFAQMGDSMNVWNNYSPGPGWILYLVNGGSDDWSYGEQTTKNKSFSMTIEVGSGSDGFWPDPSRIPTLVSENLQPNLFMTRIIDSIYNLRAPMTPSLILASSVDSAIYSVDWTSPEDTLNPPVAYELTEYQGYFITVDSVHNFDYWQNVDFTLSSARSVSPGSSFYSGMDNRSTKTLTSDEFYLVQPGDSIRLKAWYAIETDWDYAYVEVSTDDIFYTPIEGNITTTTNPHGNNKGHGITGFSSDWVDGLFDLSAYVGQYIKIRLNYTTDGFVLEEGIYFDDIWPSTGYTIENIISSSITDTFFTFIDKSPGTYHYKVRAIDAQNQYSLLSPQAQTDVLGNPSCCNGITGNVDCDGSDLIDIGDLTRLIDFLFISGAPLCCELEANIDGSIALAPDIGDITALIDYLFISGTLPQACP